MTDKKLTDDEIIKALECCYASTGDCENNCPMCDLENCNDVLMSGYVRDLIERLKIEIERLKGSVITNTIMESQRIKREAKAEAYKEFAKKLKEEFLNLQYNAKTDRKNVKIEELKEQMNWLLHTVAIETVENLLKEMVGEE